MSRRARAARAKAAPQRPVVGANFNPMILISGWIVLSTGLFLLGWSELFPSPDPEMLVFLLVVLLIFGVLGTSIRAGRPNAPERSAKLWPVWAVSGYFLAASALNGGIPIILILLGRSYDIYSFGIRYLHVAALAFCGYYGARLFADYLSRRHRRSLIGYLVILGWLGAIGSRGAVSFLVFTAAVLLVRKYGLSSRRTLFLLALFAGFLVAFGVFGDQRLAFQITQATGNTANSDAILDYAHASDSFRASGVPSTLMWPYLYAAAPIANLNAAFIYSGGDICGQSCDLTGLFVHGLLPDMLGLRLGDALAVDKFDKSVFLIKGDLTASTIFGSAVGYAGLIGALLTVGTLLLIALVTIHALRRSGIQDSGLAILATVLFFCFFENMLSYSALSMQLVFVWLAAHRTAKDTPA